MDTAARLMNLLDRDGELNQSEIAAALGVSIRTARRHLAHLCAGGEVRARRDGQAKCYTLAPGARPLPQAAETLSEGEAEALTVAALAARATLAPTPFIGYLDGAAAKLRNAWIEDVLSFEPEREGEVWSFDHTASPAPFDASLFRNMLDAVRERRPILADYFTASTRKSSTGRRLHPLGLVVRDGSWMLAAWCCRSEMVKDFALPGFENITVLDSEWFDPPDEFDLSTHARDRFGALAGADVHTIRIEVTPDALPYFERKAYHPTQQIEEVSPDGTAIVSFEAEGLEDIATFVRSWGPKVRVVEPGELARRIRDDARKTLGCYE